MSSQVRVLTPRPLRIAMIAAPRFPIAEPFSGGLEAQTWQLCDGLRRRGHRVDLFAAEGSDHAHPITFPPPDWGVRRSEATDSTMPRRSITAHQQVFRRIRQHLASYADHYDVIHNQTLQPEPLTFAEGLPVPLVTTLHTPPFPEIADVIGPGSGEFVAVSEFIAGQWTGLPRPATVIHNGVDPATWRFGPGGDALVWSGRIVPEKAPITP